MLDYNFNVETVMSSDSFLKVNEPLLILELFLSGENQAIKRVVVEMNMDEARAFIDQLRAIEKVSLDCTMTPFRKSSPPATDIA